VQSYIFFFKPHTAQHLAHKILHLNTFNVLVHTLRKEKLNTKKTKKTPT